MIIFRYLFRELLLTLLAVTSVLLVIIMSGRFIKYLAQAAQGILDPGVLMMIMGYRLPGFLELILPLGLFLGILLAYGRLHLESEMAVLQATGMSPTRILLYTMGPATLVAAIVGGLSLELGPRGLAEVERILSEQDAMTEFDTLVPGRFQTLPDGSRVTYTREMSGDRTRLMGVFISETVAGAKDGTGVTVLLAETGRQVMHADGSRYLILENGYRYDGLPGQMDYRATRYEHYGALLAKPDVVFQLSKLEALPTQELMTRTDAAAWAELQWRVSLPLLVFVVVLLAVPLAKVNPRQGRFLKLIPAILLYMLYLGVLISARNALEDGKTPAVLGLWWVHGIFAAIGLLLSGWDGLMLRMHAMKKPRQEALA